MRAETARALVDLNRRFYSELADSFDGSRRSPWSGWDSLIDAALPRIDPHASSVRLLDLGCGNGRFVLRLATALRGRSLEAVGLDVSPGLLAVARERTRGLTGRFHGVMAELLQELPLREGLRFDIVALFGVLHHVPGREHRVELMRRAARSVAPGGSLLVSLWRFRDEPRIAGRAIPRQRGLRLAGLEGGEGELEPGDAFLRWGPSGSDWPCRYCHHVGPSEAERLWRDAGLRPFLELVADGPSGRSNHYLALESCG